MAAKLLLTTISLLAVTLAGCTGSGDETLAQLRSTYTDQPFKGGQDTPEHTWLMPTRDTVLFLHWNHRDPAQADGLLFVGDGFRAKGCIGPGGVTQSQIADGYVHFHKETAAQWDQGHHTDGPSTMGWWLRHVGAKNGAGPMPGMPDIVEGEIYALMPSYENAPAC